MLETTVTCVMFMYGLALLLAVVRLLNGPTLADRAMALDFVMTCAIGLIVIDAIGTGESYFLSVAIVGALLGFVGTLAFVMYIERGAKG